MRGFDGYARRMPREAPLELLAIRPETRGHEAGRTANTAKILEAEAKRITSALPRSCYTVALDQRGDSFTTEALARRLAQWQRPGQRCRFPHRRRGRAGRGAQAERRLLLVAVRADAAARPGAHHPRRTALSSDVVTERPSVPPRLMQLAVSFRWCAAHVFHVASALTIYH